MQSICSRNRTPLRVNGPGWQMGRLPQLTRPMRKRLLSSAPGLSEDGDDHGAGAEDSKGSNSLSGEGRLRSDIGPHPAGRVQSTGRNGCRGSTLPVLVLTPPIVKRPEACQKVLRSAIEVTERSERLLPFSRESASVPWDIGL
ncbi:MAG: hypothetical protein QM784_16955 [Polyangiaceae bacterium]